MKLNRVALNLILCALCIYFAVAEGWPIVGYIGAPLYFLLAVYRLCQWRDERKRLKSASVLTR